MNVTKKSSNLNSLNSIYWGCPWKGSILKCSEASEEARSELDRHRALEQYLPFHLVFFLSEILIADPGAMRGTAFNTNILHPREIHPT
jgi:hypothetical protein